MGFLFFLIGFVFIMWLYGSVQVTHVTCDLKKEQHQWESRENVKLPNGQLYTEYVCKKCGIIPNYQGKV